MKKLLLLLLLIYGNHLAAQINTKKGVSKAATNYSAPKPPSTTVNLSAGDLVAIANSPVSDITSSVIVSGNDLLAGGKVVSATAADTYVQDKIAQTIYGNSTTSEYGITYTSYPVVQALKTYLQPYAPVFEQLNNDFYEGKLFKGFIANAIADQLILCAENTKVYVTLGSRKKLREEIAKEFANDDFPKESETSQYYKDRLVSIFERTKSYLDYCMINPGGGYWDPKAGKIVQTCNDDFSNSFFFMCSFAAQTNCAIAVIIAKSKIGTIKSESKLTQGIYNIKWNIIYQPLLSYKNQSSAFDIFAIKLKVLQLATKNGTLYNFYDKDNKCPSPLAYGMFNAIKVRTATVTSSK